MEKWLVVLAFVALAGPLAQASGGNAWMGLMRAWNDQQEQQKKADERSKAFWNQPGNSGKHGVHDAWGWYDPDDPKWRQPPP